MNETTKFWFSVNQKKWLDYVDKNRISDKHVPHQGRRYCVIDNVLFEYTEMYTGNDENYAPDYDDVVFLGYGSYAANDWNIQTYLRNHPEVKLVKDEWPDVVG